MSSRDIDITDQLLDFLDIKHFQINARSCRRNCIAKRNGTVVAFPGSYPLTTLYNKLAPGGTHRFHNELVRYMIGTGTPDTSRMEYKIDPTQESANFNKSNL